MPERLFLKSFATAGGTLTLVLSTGETVVLDAMSKRRDLAGGFSEHEARVSRGDDHFDVRTLVDAGGNIVRVIAGIGPIDDDWYEIPREPEA
jgi:hypothetical protein